METSATEIEELRAELAARVDHYEAELKTRDLLIEKLKHQLAGLRRDRFGSTSETLDQLHLRLEDQEIAVGAAKPEARAPTEAKDGPKRHRLPDHLPRAERVLTPGEACGECGGGDRPAKVSLGSAASRRVATRLPRPHHSTFSGDCCTTGSPRSERMSRP